MNDSARTYEPSEWHRRILAAHRRIRSDIRETPTEQARELAASAGVELFLKLEHFQRTGSFKFRGACNKIALLTRDQASAGVITASNGNHGLAVAAAALQRSVHAEVYVSSQVSDKKTQRIESLGATVCRRGANPVDAEIAGRSVANLTGKLFISPYNDSDVIAGQGTIGLELHRELGHIDAVFVAVGGGGLVSGIGAYFKAASPKTEVVGCWPENSRVLYESLLAGRILEFPEQETLSESTAGGIEPDAITFALCQRILDHKVLVSEAEILAVLKRVFETDYGAVEGAAAVAIAAFLKEAHRYKGKKVAIVVCGRNVSPEILRRLV